MTHLKWEDMSNCSGQRELPTVGFGPQDAAKDMNDILEAFKLFFNREILGDK